MNIVGNDIGLYNTDDKTGVNIPADSITRNTIFLIKSGSVDTSVTFTVGDLICYCMDKEDGCWSVIEKTRINQTFDFIPDLYRLLSHTTCFPLGLREESYACVVDVHIVPPPQPTILVFVGRGKEQDTRFLCVACM